MNRRSFLGIAAASIFAPKFGRWYRQGSGLIVRETTVTVMPSLLPPEQWMTLTCRAVGATGMSFIIQPQTGERIVVAAVDQGGGLFSAEYRVPRRSTVQMIGYTPALDFTATRQPIVFP